MANTLGKDAEETNFPFLPLKSELRLAPWFHYTAEEKSFVIYNAYLKRVLKSDDLKKFSIVNRLVNWNYWFFPVVAYPIVRRFLFITRANSLLLKSPAPVYYFT